MYIIFILSSHFASFSRLSDSSSGSGLCFFIDPLPNYLYKNKIDLIK